MIGQGPDRSAASEEARRNEAAGVAERASRVVRLLGVEAQVKQIDTELDVMRAAIDVQKARGAYEPNLRPIRPSEAFYLATHGGARALGKAALIGTLDLGKEADLIVVDLAALLPYPKNRAALRDLSTEDVLALCVYRGGPHANLETYVHGKCIYRAPQRASVV